MNVVRTCVSCKKTKEMDLRGKHGFLCKRCANGLRFRSPHGHAKVGKAGPPKDRPVRIATSRLEA